MQTLETKSGQPVYVNRDTLEGHRTGEKIIETVTISGIESAGYTLGATSGTTYGPLTIPLRIEHDLCVEDIELETSLTNGTGSSTHVPCDGIPLSLVSASVYGKEIASVEHDALAAFNLLKNHGTDIYGATYLGNSTQLRLTPALVGVTIADGASSGRMSFSIGCCIPPRWTPSASDALTIKITTQAVTTYCTTGASFTLYVHSARVTYKRVPGISAARKNARYEKMLFNSWHQIASSGTVVSAAVTKNALTSLRNHAYHLLIASTKTTSNANATVNVQAVSTSTHQMQLLRESTPIFDSATDTDFNTSTELVARKTPELSAMIRALNSSWHYTMFTLARNLKTSLFGSNGIPSSTGLFTPDYDPYLQTLITASGTLSTHVIGVEAIKMIVDNETGSVVELSTLRADDGL